MTPPRPVVPLLVPDLPDRYALWPYLQRIDDARQYSNFGPLVREFEGRLADLFSARAGVPVHLTTVASATLGLELTLASLDLAPGSRVLVPAFTFVATATAVIRAGYVPVIADVDEAGWVLTPAIAEAAHAALPFDAVLTVAAFGKPHDAGLWQAFSARHGLPVVIDAAAAYGSQWLAPPPSPGADLTVVFSLHTTKSLPAGEGGLVVSLDARRIRQVRQRSNFGIELDASRGLPVGMTDVPGTNAKLSEYHAAIGLASLERWPVRAALRRELLQRYVAALDRASGGALAWQDMSEVMAPTLLCVRWPGAGRADRLERVCAEHGIATRRWYQPLLKHHPLAAQCLRQLPTPVCDRLAPELVGLPFFADLAPAQLERIAAAVADAALATEPARPRARRTTTSSTTPGTLA